MAYFKEDNVTDHRGDEVFQKIYNMEQLTIMQEEYLDSILNYVCAHTR